MQRNKVLVAYVPVIGKNYQELFRKHAPDVDALYVLDNDLIAEFDHLRKDLRRMAPTEIAEYIRRAEIFPEVRLLSAESAAQLRAAKPKLIMVDDEISSELHERHFPELEVEYDNSIFLRRDPNNTTAAIPVQDHREITSEKLHQDMMARATLESLRARDWWRSVGAVAITVDGHVLSAHNHHLPSDYTVYIDGDPRSLFKKGINLQTEIAVHAERDLVATAAREGISLKGAEVYVTTFPCPPCAKLLALTGIKTLYYDEGYAMLDGEEILTAFGVELVHVQKDDPSA